MNKRIPGIALTILCLLAGGMYAMHHDAGFAMQENAAVPAREESRKAVPAQSETEAIAAAETVNINTADAAALDTLPGIGPAKAAAILEYRKSHGFFRAPEDLMKVPGIKEGTYGKLAERITVGELPEEKTAEEVSREARWPGLLLPERGLSPGDRRESPEAMTAYPGEDP